ncbi:hypothetical protein TIFTF001_017808 [Ficus carica]|uniref:Uncharacterized protein n=1 Tax=Ficus carica TaxID=3494 RepID=A0AA88D8P5_FICCA|nr:hypothetical protein TIFTF001_017808 [Ficus carica]
MGSPDMTCFVLSCFACKREVPQSKGDTSRHAQGVHVLDLHLTDAMCPTIWAGAGVGTRTGTVTSTGHQMLGCWSEFIGVSLVEADRHMSDRIRSDACPSNAHNTWQLHGVEAFPFPFSPSKFVQSYSKLLTTLDKTIRYKLRSRCTRSSEKVIPHSPLYSYCEKMSELLMTPRTVTSPRRLLASRRALNLPALATAPPI